MTTANLKVKIRKNHKTWVPEKGLQRAWIATHKKKHQNIKKILDSDRTWFAACDLNCRVDSVRLEVLLDAGWAFHDLALADETGGLGGWGVEAVTPMTLVIVLKTGVGLSNVDVESCFRRKLRPAIFILAAVFVARTGHQLNSILLTLVKDWC